MQLMNRWCEFWNWMNEGEGWKAVAGAVYLAICIFDFVVVPSWIGLTRADVLASFEMMQLSGLDPSVQIKLIESLTYQHDPYTLKGGGLFHLAFGALLTGSAISRFKGDK